MWFKLWGWPSREAIASYLSKPRPEGWMSQALKVALETSDKDISCCLKNEPKYIDNLYGSDSFFEYILNDHTHNPCVYTSKTTYRIVCWTCGIYMTYNGAYAPAKISKKNALRLISLNMPSMDWVSSQERRAIYDKKHQKILWEKQKIVREEEDRNWKKWYYEIYLQSSEWFFKREEVLGRDSYACIKCSKTYGLQVHHKSYKAVSPNLPYGQEDMDDLETLCEDCHHLKHGRKITDTSNFVSW